MVNEQDEAVVVALKLCANGRGDEWTRNTFATAVRIIRDLEHEVERLRGERDAAIAKGYDEATREVNTMLETFRSSFYRMLNRYRSDAKEVKP